MFQGEQRSRCGAEFRKLKGRRLELYLKIESLPSVHRALGSISRNTHTHTRNQGKLSASGTLVTTVESHFPLHFEKLSHEIFLQSFCLFNINHFAFRIQASSLLKLLLYES